MLDRNEIEILEVALAHEERAKTFYEGLARRQGDTPAGDLFAFLAEEEDGHIRKLSAKYGISASVAAWGEKALPYMIDLDRLAWEEGVEAGGAEGPDALRKGLWSRRRRRPMRLPSTTRPGKRSRTGRRGNFFPNWSRRRGFTLRRSRDS